MGAGYDWDEAEAKNDRSRRFVDNLVARYQAAPQDLPVEQVRAVFRRG